MNDFQNATLALLQTLRHEDIASRVGVSMMTVYRWAKGSSAPSRGHQLKVMRLLDKEQEKSARHLAKLAVVVPAPEVGNE